MNGHMMEKSWLKNLTQRISLSPFLPLKSSGNEILKNYVKKYEQSGSSFTIIE
jgi:hypothetical protein